MAALSSKPSSLSSTHGRVSSHQKHSALLSCLSTQHFSFKGISAPRLSCRCPRPCRAEAFEPGEPNTAGTSTAGEESPESCSVPASPRRTKRAAESTDWIASAVTRRFGIGAGLAWVGFLAFGVISEQLKTRREVFLEEALTRDVEEVTEVSLPNGVRYSDIRIGGGAYPQPGDLVVVSLTGTAAGADGAFVDTTQPGSKDLVFTFGVKPYRRGVTEGLVAALATTRAGGRRIVKVPAALGFGQEGAVFGGMGGEDVVVPGNADLEYVVELKKVSISPS